MPNALIKKIHEQTGKSTKHLDEVFRKVEKSAKKEGYKNPYAIATAVVDKYSHYKPESK